VKKAEMKLSESKSKFVKGWCMRKTEVFTTEDLSAKISHYCFDQSIINT